MKYHLFSKFTISSSHVNIFCYACDTYFVTSQSEMQKTEKLQQIFTKKIPEVSQLNYWERMKVLKLYSQERRMERYRILYAWKILEGFSPNCGLEVQHSDRRGRELKVPVLKSKGKFQTLREKSFQVHGAKLFNSLPKSIRNLTKLSVDGFKQKLDVYLQSIPDEPILPGYTPSACNQHTGSPSNSLIDLKKPDRFRTPG